MELDTKREVYASRFLFWFLIPGNDHGSSLREQPGLMMICAMSPAPALLVDLSSPEAISAPMALLQLRPHFGLADSVSTFEAGAGADAAGAAGVEAGADAAGSACLASVFS